MKGFRKATIFIILSNIFLFLLPYNSEASTAVLISPNTLPAATVGAPYSQAFTASGGIAPYTWSATSLPSGLILNTVTGEVYGTPTASGSFPITITATDASSLTVTNRYTLTVHTVTAIVITTSTLTSATVGAPYSQTITVSGGAAPYTWKTIGLPPSLAIDPTSGVISGTPVAKGTFLITISATDVNNSNGTVTYILTVNDSNTPRIRSQALTVNSAAAPIPLYTAQDLFNVRNNLSGNYIQMNDIDLSGYSNWDPIGDSSGYLQWFFGIFDGNGYTIRGLKINNSTVPYVGLFGVCTGGTIKNVNIVQASVAGNNYCLGILAGYENNSTISNCTTSGTISGLSSHVGGLIGETGGGTISSCCSTGNSLASGNNNVCGGLIGRSTSAKIAYCNSSSDTQTAGINTQSGVLIGCSVNDTVNGCYATGSASGIICGGLLGYSTSSVTDCYSTGKASTTGPSGYDCYAGGLIGLSYSGTATNSYSCGNVSASGQNVIIFIGGLVGDPGSATINSCYYDETTSGQSDTGKGTPVTTAAMMQRATFVGWDFTNTWGIHEGTSYPFLLPIKKLQIDKSLLGRPSYCLFGRSSVNLSTGNFIDEATDFNIPSVGLPLAFTRFYNSQDDYVGPQGKGWTNNLNAHLGINQDGSIGVAYADGHVYKFSSSSGSYTAPPGCYETLAGATGGGYTLTFKDHTKYTFDSSGKLQSIADNNNNVITLTYINNLLISATDQLGRSLNFAYDANNRLQSITDSCNDATNPFIKQIKYAYDAAGNLISAEADSSDQQASWVTKYGYDTGGSHSLTDIFTPKSDTSPVLHNTYDNNNRVSDQSDGKQNKWTFAYNTSNTVMTGPGPDNDQLSCTYDSNYRYISLQDALGHVTNYSYDDNNNCTDIKTTNTINGSTVNIEDIFTYDGNGNLTDHKDQDNNEVNYVYVNNNLTSVTDVTDTKTHRNVQNTYDSNNNLQTTTTNYTDDDGSAKSINTTYAYGQYGLLTSTTTTGTGTYTYTPYLNGLPQDVTTPAGIKTSYSYDPDGRCLSVTDNASHTTTYSYDAAGDLVKTVNALNNTCTYGYDLNGNRIWMTDANQNKKDTAKHTCEYDYDGNNQLTQTRSYLSDGTCYVTRNDYDSENRLSTFTDANYKQTTYTYYLNGKLKTVKDASGCITSYNYDDLGNTVSQTGSNGEIKIAYDTMSRPVSVQDALNNTVSYGYDKQLGSLNSISATQDGIPVETDFVRDALNRLVKTTTNKNGQVTSVATQSYNDINNMTSFTDPNNNQTELQNDSSGRLSLVTLPTQDAVKYSYNNDRGFLSTVTNGRGQNIGYKTYDAAGRLTEIDYPDDTVTFNYDDNGNLTDTNDKNGNIHRTYDTLNRITFYTDCQNNTIQYAYDGTGNLTTLTYPGGKTVQYQYDDANRLQTVTDWNNCNTTYAYDQTTGRLQQVTRPDGSYLILSYFDNGWISKQQDYDKGNHLLAEYDLTYDELGNIKTVTSPTTSTTTFSLTEPALEYNSKDNRLTKYNGNEVQYDQDGNMTNGPLNGAMVEYQYDSRNRLTSVGDTSYQYDAENNRIGVTKGSNQTKYVVDPLSSLSQVLVRTDSQGQQTFYVYGLGLIGQDDGDGYKNYHYDFRGNTTFLTDKDGKITDQYQYEPFGRMTYASSPPTTPFLYDGRDGVITDDNSLCYMRARYYNPETRRFINRDILVGRLSDPQSLNSYGYARNNPLSYSDPTGMLYYYGKPGDEQLDWSLSEWIAMNALGAEWWLLPGQRENIKNEAAKIRGPKRAAYDAAHRNSPATGSPAISAPAAYNPNSVYYTNPAYTQGYSYGQCTWYCAARAQEVAGHKLDILYMGNGGQWLQSANSRGFPCSNDKTNIQPDSIAVFAKDSSGKYGHVAFIESVSKDDKGNITGVIISEYNVLEKHGYDCVPLSVADLYARSYGSLEGYIYIQKGGN